MVLVSFAEIFSIGAVLPFLAALTNPERLFHHTLSRFFILNLGIRSPDQLLFLLTVIFGFAAFSAGALRLTLLRMSISLSYAVGADLSVDIYRRTLYQQYAIHTSRNSSEIIDGIMGKVGSVILVLSSMLTFLGSCVILVAILFALIAIDPLVALSVFSGFGTIYLIITKVTQRRQLVNGQLMARESIQLIKSLQEGLGGIRDILIDGTQEIYCNIYRSADISLRRAQGSSQFIAQSPRYGMEAFGMILIALLAYALSYQAGGVAVAIPVLGALALGAQRLLPILQQAYQAWSSIQGQRASLQDALDLLDQPLPGYASESSPQPMSFQREISFHQLGFKYSVNSPWVLKRLDLSIPKGGRIGFIGETGSGKSTLLDIVMGLLMPTEGCMKIDGKTITVANHRAWQAHIAHVPQMIFLADASIEENIAFGVPKDRIDLGKVKLAAQQAQISQVIEGWDNGYHTMVGERGIRLSGGQRQRIGIARALYKEADVIIFDEATSALDGETELAVMESIEGLNKNLTILIIAHRTSTLKNCTQIVKLANQTVERVGSYQEIIRSLP